MPDMPPSAPGASQSSPADVNTTRSGSGENTPSHAGRSRFRRALLPIWLLVCAGVLALFAYAVWDGLQPVTRVHAVSALSWKDATFSGSNSTAIPSLIMAMPLPGGASGVVVNASPEVKVHSTLEGKVKTILVKEGEKVHRGQPLLLLDDAEWQCARARLFELRAEQKAPPARENGAIDTTVAEEPLQRAYECVSAACARCSVVSPIDGIVLKLIAQEGDNVRASGVFGTGDDGEERPLVILQSLRDRAVSVSLTPAEAYRVGMLRSIRLSTKQPGGGAPVTGTLAEMKGNVVQGRPCFEALIPLSAETAPSLKPGDQVQVEFLPNGIEQELADITLIPRASVSNAHEDEAVFWVIGVDNRLQQRRAPRRPEWDTEERCAILRGAQPGEPFVVDPDPSLQEGQKVTTE